MDNEHTEVLERLSACRTGTYIDVEFAVAAGWALDELERLQAILRASNGPGEHPHDLWCNANRKEPVGCDGCSCTAGREIKRLQAIVANQTTADGVPKGDGDTVYVHVFTHGGMFTTTPVPVTARIETRVVLPDGGTHRVKYSYSTHEAAQAAKEKP